nr:protein cornichon 4 [Cryptomonas curvata]UXY87876.1 ER-derived vesicles protein ERV14 [Cryptomonas curvata]
MYNKQRTSIPNQFLAYIGCLTTAALIFFVTYTYKLFKDLSIDTVNPGEVCEKVNYLRGPEYIAHVVLAIVLVLRGWWFIGILNFPFLFYNFAQWYENRHLVDSTKVFSILSQEIRVIKIKALFFIIIVLYNTWLWLVWVPPDYTIRGTSWNIMKSIQVSN